MYIKLSGICESVGFCVRCLQRVEVLLKAEEL